MKCKICGKEITEGLRVCSSCNSDLENSNEEKQRTFPIFPGFLAAATAYGIPVVAANVVGKDKKASNAVSAAEVANKTVTASALAGATAYGIPSPSVGSVVGATAVAAVAAIKPIPYPEGAARTLYGMPPISSRFFKDSDCIMVRNEKICNHCKAKIKLDEKICPKCGKKLGFSALYEEDK